MSDFLNFNIIDEIPDGEPRFNITDNPDGTKNIELANELVQEGTTLNKVTFDKLKKINTIMGYEKINGIYDPINDVINLNHPNINESDIIDSIRVLLQPINFNVPITNVSLIGEATSIASAYNTPKSVQLNNGNILVVGCNSYQGNYAGYITIYNVDGVKIVPNKYVSEYLYDPKIIKLSNNNIMLLGGDNASGVYYTIIDENGNIVVPTKILSLNYANYDAIHLSNNNIMILGNQSRTAHFTIIDENGDIIVNDVTLYDNMYNPKLVELDNNNIMIVGSTNSGATNSANVVVVNNLGNIVKDITNIGDGFTYVNILKLNNGNVFVMGCKTSDRSGDYYFSIIDENINILVQPTKLGNNFKYFDFIQLSNNNILIVGSVYCAIVSLTGEIIMSKTNISSYMSYPKLLKYSGGNTIIVGVQDGSPYKLYVSIIKDDGTLLLKDFVGKNNFMNPYIIELNNSNLFIVGSGSSSAYTGYFQFLKALFSENIVCKLNNKNIDTLLKQNSYYELVFNNNQNKFIANEITI